MDIHRDSGFAGRLEVVPTGRRRRLRVEEKILLPNLISGDRNLMSSYRTIKGLR